MNTKLLYILVSNEVDTYFEMMIMSAFSAKYRMPDCHICLLMDDNTECSLSEPREVLLHKYIDETVVVQLDQSLSAKRKSRYLKTNMRNYVEGDFLYIDIDTVIMQSLELVDKFDFEFAAVLDGHARLDKHHFKWIIEEDTHFLDYNIKDLGVYYNAGVLFVKDTVDNREFFKQWHELYKKNINKVDQDQPSMNYLCNKYRNITELPPEYNTQIMIGLQYLYNAKILHFFSSMNKPLLELSSHQFLTEIKEKGITDQIKQKILNPISTFLPCTALIREDDFYNIYSSVYYKFKRLLFHGGRDTINYSKEEHILYVMNTKILKLERKILNLLYKIRQKRQKMLKFW